MPAHRLSPRSRPQSRCSSLPSSSRFALAVTTTTRLPVARAARRPGRPTRTPALTGGEGGDRGEGGGADDEGGGDGRQEATEVRGEVPPATSPAPSPKASHSGTRKIPRVGPKGEVVPVPTDAGPGETLGKDGSVAIKEGALVSKPLPETASSRGRLVRGYPSDVLPTIPGSQVRSSSVSSSSRGVQVAFTGSATLKAEAIAAHYRLALASYGFTESSVPAVGGSTARRLQPWQRLTGADDDAGRQADDLLALRSPARWQRLTASMHLSRGERPRGAAEREIAPGASQPSTSWSRSRMRCQASTFGWPSPSSPSCRPRWPVVPTCVPSAPARRSMRRTSWWCWWTTTTSGR